MPSAILLLGLAAPIIFSPSRSWRLNGDCRRANVAAFSTIFLVDNALNKSLQGVEVNGGGLSVFTNSSGMAIVGGGNFTDFAVVYNQQRIVGSLAGYRPALICLGNSYYRVVMLTLAAEPGTLPSSEAA